MYYRLRKEALTLAAAGLVLVTILSPILEEWRYTMQVGVGSSRGIEEVLVEKTAKQTIADSMQSVLQRADILENTMGLLTELDLTQDYAGFRAYEGFLWQPLPRFFARDKPITRSKDGTLDGRLASILWQNATGTDSIGGLTEFGGLTMYWQFGWWGVVLGAPLCGALSKLWFRWLSGQGTCGAIALVSTALPITFINVPASLDVLIEAVLGSVPYLLFFYLAAWFLPQTRQHKPQ
jgi:hypothetical protein